MPMGGWMPTLDESIAREYRTAQLNTRRIRRIIHEFRAEPSNTERFEQVLIATGACCELEKRQAARRLFDVLDRDATRVLQAVKGKNIMSPEDRADLQGRIHFHDRLAAEAGDDEAHAATHLNISEMLRKYLKDNGGKGKPAAPEPEKPVWRPGLRSRL
jgi:hypothetical protein